METIVVREPLQVEQRETEDAQAVLETCMMGGRIDKRNKAQLADPRQAAEVGRVDHLPHAAGKRNVDLRRNADQRRRASSAATSGSSSRVDMRGLYRKCARGEATPSLKRQRRN